MDVTKITLGLDVWEGTLEVDENIARLGDVRFLLIRLNDMRGGHHRDEGFDKQWLEASPFIRIPYFVYNPWVDGRQNYEWLASNLPQGVKAVAVDIEVRKDGYSPDAYAVEVDKFIGLLIANGLTPIIYSGSWFKTCLSRWPGNVGYWWARYPYALYPASAVSMTFDQLRAKLAGIIWNPGTGIPGPCRLWQCSGDRIILPGTLRTMDINVFNGTVDEMITYYKIPAVQLPQMAHTPTVEERLTAIEARLTALEGR